MNMNCSATLFIHLSQSLGKASDLQLIAAVVPSLFLLSSFMLVWYGCTACVARAAAGAQPFDVGSKWWCRVQLTRAAGTACCPLPSHKTQPCRPSLVEGDCTSWPARRTHHGNFRKAACSYSHCCWQYIKLNSTVFVKVTVWFKPLQNNISYHHHNTFICVFPN